jgi:hypothetical protein
VSMFTKGNMAPVTNNRPISNLSSFQFFGIIVNDHLLFNFKFNLHTSHHVLIKLKYTVTDLVTQIMYYHLFVQNDSLTEHERGSLSAKFPENCFLPVILLLCHQMALVV